MFWSYWNYLVRNGELGLIDLVQLSSIKIVPIYIPLVEAADLTASLQGLRFLCFLLGYWFSFSLSGIIGLHSYHVVEVSMRL